MAQTKPSGGEYERGGVCARRFRERRPDRFPLANLGYAAALVIHNRPHQLREGWILLTLPGFDWKDRSLEPVLVFGDRIDESISVE